MKLQIIVNPDGEVVIAGVEGNFEENKAQIQKLLNGLQAGGLAIKPTSEIEQHRHDGGEGQRHVAHN